MAFGSPTGPPASAQQVKQLTALVLAAGHTDFRDARGPLQLTQRQAAGKFTRDEADALIERLEAEADPEAQGGDGATDQSDAPPRTSVPRARPASGVRRATPSPASLRAVPSEKLAAELQRRGWVVLEP